MLYPLLRKKMFTSRANFQCGWDSLHMRMLLTDVLIRIMFLCPRCISTVQIWRISAATLPLASVQASSGSMSRLATVTRAYTRSPIARFGRLRRCKGALLCLQHQLWTAGCADVGARMSKAVWMAIEIIWHLEPSLLKVTFTCHWGLSRWRTRRPGWAASRGWGR